jgi:hypothetical protein
MIYVAGKGAAVVEERVDSSKRRLILDYHLGDEAVIQGVKDVPPQENCRFSLRCTKLEKQVACREQMLDIESYFVQKSSGNEGEQGGQTPPCFLLLKAFAPYTKGTLHWNSNCSISRKVIVTATPTARPGNSRMYDFSLRSMIP